MAGTDEDAVATGDDDALYVLTAVLLTPAKFPSVLGDDYPEACAALDLAPLAEGYGLVLGQDGDGRPLDGRHRRRLAGRRRHRVLGLRDGVRAVARTSARSSPRCPAGRSMSPSRRPGCPRRTIPRPSSADRPPLAPPDTTTWGPAQRRLGADEIALQWAVWREQIDDERVRALGGRRERF